MSTAESKELASMLKSLRHEYATGGETPSVPPATSLLDGAGLEPTLGHFLKSFLLWESTTAKAAQALKKIEQAVVDFNELRMCMPDELVKIVGERYPRAGERALRLRTALNVIYSREHAVTLEPMAKLGKKEAREYLASIDGVPTFVANRVCLLSMSHHAAPVDSRIHRRLVEAKVASADTSPDEAAASLEKKSRPGELLETYLLLQAWADEAQYAPVESHLSDIRPMHKPVDKRVREEHEQARKAARKKLSATRRKLKDRKGGKSGTPGKKKPGR